MIGEWLGKRYRINNLLGEGGMAKVYRAFDSKLGREVAVKVLNQEMAKSRDICLRFRQEARAVSAMDHPNILKVYDFSGEDSKELWIVTEILSGKHLADFTQAMPGRYLHPVLATIIVREILKALQKAHESGLVHRDIKPENIMVLDSGLIKLMDFGIAKDHSRRDKTMAGTFMGSPSYMSPEQIKGREIDPRSDIYSLGVLFYEITTGTLPYQGHSIPEVISRIMAGRYLHPIKLMPSLPETVNDCIVTALSQDPGSRFQSALAFAGALDHCLEEFGFSESHVELERFFKSRSQFEQRLAALGLDRRQKIQKRSRADSKAPVPPQRNSINQVSTQYVDLAPENIPTPAPYHQPSVARSRARASRPSYPSAPHSHPGYSLRRHPTGYYYPYPPQASPPPPAQIMPPPIIQLQMPAQIPLPMPQMPQPLPRPQPQVIRHQPIYVPVHRVRRYERSVLPSLIILLIIFGGVYAFWKFAGGREKVEQVKPKPVEINAERKTPVQLPPKKAIVEKPSPTAIKPIDPKPTTIKSTPKKVQSQPKEVVPPKVIAPLPTKNIPVTRNIGLKIYSNRVPARLIIETENDRRLIIDRTLKQQQNTIYLEPGLYRVRISYGSQQLARTFNVSEEQGPMTFNPGFD